MSTENLTWRSLKEFINSLPEEFLDGSVHWWGDEKGGDIQSVHRLDEDYVETDYACEPASAQEYKDDEEPYPVAHVKGTPILSIE